MPSVLRKTTEDELVDLINYAQTLALDFLHTTVRGAKCVEALRIAAERGIVRLG